MLHIKNLKKSGYRYMCSVRFSSVAQSCLTLCDPMDHSTPGLPVHHQLLESTQTHVHWVSDAIQPSHPLSFPSPPTFSLSQHQGLFKWVSSSHQVAKVLQFQLQYQSFQWTLRIDFLLDELVWSPCSPRDSQESSPTPQFKSINSLVLSFLYSPALTSIHDHWKNHVCVKQSCFTVYLKLTQHCKSTVHQQNFFKNICYRPNPPLNLLSESSLDFITWLARSDTGPDGKLIEHPRKEKSPISMPL